MLYNYNKFVNENIEIVNEGFLDFFKKMFNKLNDYAKNIKESGEIDNIVENSKKEIDNLFKEKIQDLINDEVKKQSSNKDSENNTETQTNIEQSGQTNESYIINEANEEKNPIDVAIDEWKDLVKEKMKKYLNSKNEKVKLYAQAKLSELNQHILNQKIKAYKSNKLMDLATKTQDELKQNAKMAKNISSNLDKLVSGNSFEVGKTYKYTTENGDETTITIDKLSDDNKEVISAKNADGKKINPHSDKIGDLVEE